MGGTDISPGLAVLLSTSESMTEYSSFLVTALNVNSGMSLLSEYLQTISESLKPPRLENDLFGQLMIINGSSKISPLSYLISSTLRLFSTQTDLLFNEFSLFFTCLIFFLKKLMQKLFCASHSLLLTEFFTC